MIELVQEEKSQHIPVASIKVVGVGGAGGNTINCMVQSDYKGVEFIAINTDAQALQLSDADKTLQIGVKSTKGLGAGANPEVGKRAAEEDLDKILAEISTADIVFVTGGMGGGTGSGALPVVVKALKEKGILTIVVTTKPFAFEGKKRARVADEAIAKIREHADTLLIVPNQKLIEIVDEQVSMVEGFQMINNVLNQSVKGVSDIITRAGHINVDFADVREVMHNQGLAVMGTGRASGDDRARRAALEAISSPLLENMDIAGAKGVLLNLSGSKSLGLHEISAAASLIYEKADPDANIILGSVIDENLKDEVVVTVIATGFEESDVQIQATTLAKEDIQAQLKRDLIKEEPAIQAAMHDDDNVQTDENKQPIEENEEEAPSEEPMPAEDNQSNEESINMKGESCAIEEQKQEESQAIVLEKSQVASIRFAEEDDKGGCCGHGDESPSQDDEHSDDDNNSESSHQEQEDNNVAQMKDLDVPTFMRRSEHREYKGKKHKKYKKQKQQYYSSGQ